MIIDAHIHLWNRLHGEDTGIHREALTWGRAREGDTVYYACPPAFHDSLSTYERALAQMEYSGVARAVVLQEFMDGKQDDYLAEVRRHEPQRFSCLALFDRRFYEDPRAAFAEAIGEKRLQGFLVKTPDPFPDIVTPALQPVWDACAERGLPVVLKNGAPETVGALLAATPGLKVVFSHFAGAWDPIETFRERLRIAADHPNVTLDSGGLTYRHRYPFPHPKELLHEAVETVGAEKIAWGSDYPRPGLVVEASYQQQLDFFTIECDFLTDAQREAIFSGTALRVYRWEE
jgi:predicted TIM-barrel fold metal-dependent hydrolase